MLYIFRACCPDSNNKQLQRMFSVCLNLSEVPDGWSFPEQVKEFLIGCQSFAS